jgi:transcription elongation factor Elf1
MGRRRRKVVKIVRKTLPELFLCPRCGKNTVKATVDKKRGQAVVVCSNCNLNTAFSCALNMGEVDAYCRFVDQFYAGETKEEPVVE